MKVRSVSRPLLAIGTLFLGAALVLSASAVAADAPAHKNSAALAKPLKEAKDLFDAKKYPDAIAKLKTAEGISGKTPYDEHLIQEMLGASYARTNDYAEAAKAFEAQIDDGFTPESELPRLVRASAQANYQIKNYDKAIDYGNRAIKGGYADDEMKVLVGQAYYLKGDWKGTLKFEESIVDAQIKAGQTPKDESLQLILSSCVKLNDNDCETRALERLVTYYPKPDYWYQLLYALRSAAGSNEANALQVYRLMFDVDVLKSGDDYKEMAADAQDAGSPGEAQRVLEKGIQKNVFTDARSQAASQRLLASAKKAADTDQAGLAHTETEANASPTGAKNVGVGLAYLGYGQYDKAVDQLSKGIQKGSLKNDADAHLLLGIAQLKAGHKDDAVKAFKDVKGDPTLERLAALWVLHAKQA
jgi:tetratricopeptide (TPR) repeat protein